VASPAEMEGIEVSPEMLTFLGVGHLTTHTWPANPVAFEFRDALSFIFHSRPTSTLLNRAAADDRLIFVVARSACERLLGDSLDLNSGTSYLLASELRAIARAIRDCDMQPAAALPYRLAKSIELVCELMRACADDALIPASGASLSFADCRRVAQARQLIEDNWDKPLTLSQIARGCGLNRSKLSRGFRELYRCSVSEALAERRLAEARQQLISTDLPIGLIGYRNGYQNNASFSRAFCRRFGVPPSEFRMKQVAA
jgi:AraC family transcriptional regulator, transcriptional activator of the genes for pyochelin and ferripyochelin receptors